MNKTIEFQLNSKSINAAIKELEKYKKRISTNLTKLIDAMCMDGESYAYYYYQNAENGFDYVDSYETISSIKGYREGNKGIITVGGAAVWIEFGTGVTYNKGGDQYHANRGELGMSVWGTYGNGGGADPNGWYYEKNGQVHHTFGLPENPFMALTAQRLKAEFKRNAAEVFSK